MEDETKYEHEFQDDNESMGKKVVEQKTWEM